MIKKIGECHSFFRGKGSILLVFLIFLFFFTNQVRRGGVQGNWTIVTEYEGF